MGISAGAFVTSKDDGISLEIKEDQTPCDSDIDRCRGDDRLEEEHRNRASDNLHWGESRVQVKLLA
jgi:hypothetical protein